MTDQDSKKLSERARELERRDLEATEASRRAAEESRRKQEDARKEVDGVLVDYLAKMRAAPDVDVDEEHTAVRRLDVLMARAAAESATVIAVSSDPDEAPDTLRPADVAAEATTARAEHILVVDDDPGLVGDLVSILRLEGYSVRSAADGIEALEKALKSTVPPDIMLLDLALPYLSGMGVLAALQTTRLACLPVLIITGTSKENVPPALQREYVYISKPIDLPELLDQLRARIGEWRALPKVLE